MGRIASGRVSSWAVLQRLNHFESFPIPVPVCNSLSGLLGRALILCIDDPSAPPSANIHPGASYSSRRPAS